MTDKAKQNQSKLDQLIKHKEMLDTKIGILKAERKVTEAQIALEERIGLSNGSILADVLALKKAGKMMF